MTHVWQLLRRSASWHVHSQQVSRRNALAATLVLADLRREREDVEEFLAGQTASRQPFARPVAVRRLA